MKTVTSPAFRANPRGWASHWIDAMLAPGVALSEAQRNYLLGRRVWLATHEDRKPGGDMYDKICRIARQTGVMRQRARMRKLRDIRQEEAARDVAIPERFRLGARIPAPPPLRRPIIALGGGSTETWDPAVR